MSHEHHHGPPPGEAPRWLDEPANLKKLTRGFFGLAALIFLADLVFLFVERHHAFGGEHAGPEGLQNVEGWFGFYPLYGLVSILLLVGFSVLLRKLVMRPEDYYSKDYPESQEDQGGAHHG